MINAEMFSKKWPVMNLSNAVDFLDSQRRPVKAADRVEGPYPYYGANGQQGTINNYIFDEPLILLAEDGGHFGIPGKRVAYSISGKTWVNNHAHVLKPKEKVDLNFLCKQLEFYDVTKYITGSTRGKLTKADASRIKVCIPPIEEQRRIAAMLDKADAIRRKREQALALADDFLRATFLDMFGDPFTNPKGWEMGEFGCAILSANNGLSRRRKIEQNVGEIVLRIQDLQANEILTNHPNRISLDSAEKKKFLLQNGDLLLVRVNGNPDYVGRCAVFTDHVEGVAHNDHIIRIKLNELINPFFVSYLFNHASGKRLLSAAIKTSAGQYTISRDGLEKVKLPIPPKKLQNVFETRSALIRKSTINLLRSLDLANNNFVSLSQRAFRGEI